MIYKPWTNFCIYVNFLTMDFENNATIILLQLFTIWITNLFVGKQELISLLLIYLNNSISSSFLIYPLLPSPNWYFKEIKLQSAVPLSNFSKSGFASLFILILYIQVYFSVFNKKNLKCIGCLEILPLYINILLTFHEANELTECEFHEFIVG